MIFWILFKYLLVIDISGPFITSDKEFPLLAGSFVEMTCKTNSSGVVTNVFMNCLDTIVKSRRENKNAYVAKVSKMVTSLDNGRKCSCKASGDITSSSSITLQVIKAPIVETVDKVFCNNTASVILSCRISGEMSKFGFSQWEHRFHDTYIRSVTGNISGNVSFFAIDSCNYEDNGEYICEAWNQDSKQLFRRKSSISVIVTGPPVVIDNFITIGTNVTLSVKFLSMERPYYLEWYYENCLLPNSTLYFQNSSKDDFVIRMYGQIVIQSGFTANLTMVKRDFGIFKCLLENDYGTATSRFELNNNDKGSEDFNISLFGWISLTTFLFLVSMILSTVLVYRQRKGSHINAVSRTIYFAAPCETGNARIYNVTSSHYEEIDDGYIVPNSTSPSVVPNLANPCVLNDTENYEENQEGVSQYLELE
ncbi:Hypothetical predicted protein [Mytilus galloprovincialis]|uniref:Ig-like domain-containing protein n=1 Tax=Mytilus galloprovincialis TaxID=29158 RepID=A0A8B6FK05_MYTGA|nr:Hypothetical predicted protein [Mytilus galloprovincialis]